MAKSSYEIRVAGTVPLDLLENFHQIETVEPAGTILHAVQLDNAGLWGLIDALRNAGIDLIEIRRDVNPSEYWMVREIAVPAELRVQAAERRMQWSI